MTKCAMFDGLVEKVKLYGEALLCLLSQAWAGRGQNVEVFAG